MTDAQKQLQGLSDDYQKLQTGLCGSTYCHSPPPLPNQLIGFFILELEEAVGAREKLESQQQENKTVQKVYYSEYLSWSLHIAHGFGQEFSSLDDNTNVYKLVGSILLKQDKSEAVMAVNGRLDFIEKEMYVLGAYFRAYAIIGLTRTLRQQAYREANRRYRRPEREEKDRGKALWKLPLAPSDISSAPRS